jgi:DNA-binding transcriptional LysR family regulator
MLRNAGIVPNIRQTAGQMPTLISLVAAGMGVAILPASAVKHNAGAVIGCEIADPVPSSEIGLATAKDASGAVVGNFRSLALQTFGPAGERGRG